MPGSRVIVRLKISLLPSVYTLKLNQRQDFAESAIDAGSFSNALEAGALEACLVYVRRSEPADDVDVELNCRLAERLFHCERRDEALECGRRALALAPADAETLY